MMIVVCSIAAGAAAGGAPPKTLDGPGKYTLLGFVSHMGASTAAGHYVAHIRKDGRWVIYNDEKVRRCVLIDRSINMDVRLLSCGWLR